MKKIAITNRKLCKNDFFEQIEYICSKKSIYALILREKDLSDEDYTKYAVKCNEICKRHNVLFFINSKINIAKKLDIKNIQISFKDFMNNKKELNCFENIGISVHSLAEAAEVEDFSRGNVQCTIYNKPFNYSTVQPFNCFLIVGHIFQTDCKKGLEPRGTDFLKEICDKIKMPIYAIGGINKKTLQLLDGINVAGVCMMSEMMKNHNMQE